MRIVSVLNGTLGVRALNYVTLLVILRLAYVVARIMKPAQRRQVTKPPSSSFSRKTY